MMTNFAAPYHNSFYATAAPGHLDYSTSLMNAAVVHSTISMMSSRPRSVPLSWPATELPRDLLSKSFNKAPQTIQNGAQAFAADAAQIRSKDSKAAAWLSREDSVRIPT